jgi:hypothetical protein
VIFEYTSAIGADGYATVPLRGLPRVDSLDVSVVDGAAEPLHVHEEMLLPADDVRFRVTAARPIIAAPTPLDSNAIALVDTSASASPSRNRPLVDALRERGTTVLAYDQAVSADLEREPLGMADLNGALQVAAARGASRIVVVGGSASGPVVAPSGVRVDVLATSFRADARVLQPLAANGVLVEDATSIDRLDFGPTPEEPRAVQGATWMVLENDGDVAVLREHESGKPRSPVRPGRAHRVKAPVLRMASVTVNGRLPPEVIQRTMRLNAGAFRACYADALQRRPGLSGRAVLKYVIDRSGAVSFAVDGGSDVDDAALLRCMIEAASKLTFPPPEGGMVTVIWPFSLSPEAPSPEPLHFGLASKPWRPTLLAGDPPDDPAPPSPWSYEYALMRLDPGSAPRSPLGFVARGSSRALGSLAELYPDRPELLRAAGVRMHDSLGISLLRRAVEARSDQPTSHHLLGLALLEQGDVAGARAAFAAGARDYEERYAGARELLRADAEMLDDRTPRTRVTLAWETDTSTVALRVLDATGEVTGGTVLANARDGYGPVALDPGPNPTTIKVRLDRRGLGGDVLGVVHVIKRGDDGSLTVNTRPFEIMTEGAELDLGAP